MNVTLCLAAAALIGAGSAAWADDDVLLAAQSQVAQIVSLAKVAPMLCPWIETDEDAVRDLMAHVQITGRDIMDPARFGPEDEAVARSFAQSAREDAEVACGQLFDQLGARAHLVRRKP